MAVAAPKRRSSAAPAPAPSRTAPPKRRKVAPGPSPIRRTKGAAAPATAPHRGAPARRSPARAPQRARPKTKRPAQPALALAAARTAGAVRHLPDSGLVVRMTRGRLWIGVLGVLLVGIVTLNVVTLSFAASSGRIDEEITTLEKENSSLVGRDATKYGADRVRAEAGELGLAMPTEAAPQVIEFDSRDIQTAATRLAGAE